jgi:predicted thioesterase
MAVIVAIDTDIVFPPVELYGLKVNVDIAIKKINRRGMKIDIMCLAPVLA